MWFVIFFLILNFKSIFYNNSEIEPLIELIILFNNVLQKQWLLAIGA